MDFVGASTVRVSLKTSDRGLAGKRRDALEKADNAYWDSLRIDGKATSLSKRIYEAAFSRARAWGFSYHEHSDMRSVIPDGEMLARLSAIATADTGQRHTADSLLGDTRRPKVLLSGAFDVYVNEIKSPYLLKKDDEGRSDWLKNKQRSLDLFIELFGDRPVDQYTRAEGRRFYDYWHERMMGREGRKIGGSLANRNISNVRVLIDDYCMHVGIDIENPLRGFSFEIIGKKKILPFSDEELCSIFLVPSPLMNMRFDTRLVTLAMIETGCRPSELLCLDATTIILDHDVPHIVIQEEEGKSVKTENSNRVVPLLGISLEAMKLAPNGFPRWRTRRKDFSSTVNPFCRKNKLFTSDLKRLYSIRHSFKDRAIRAGIDEETRNNLIGHAIDVERYGIGGGLAFKQKELAKMIMAFDPAILQDMPFKLNMS